ncbi:MAG TPA: UxaA family hydrolase [Firmicutes bacterium]|jgi:altronate dehydratase large subunit|nr:UxaA family hydrolase [Bacillota bacterium]
MQFMGYRRPDGRVGTRNLVGVLPTVVCANEVAERITKQVAGATAFLHHHGCCQTPPDIERVSFILGQLGKHPNLAGVLLVSLGCESVNADAVAEEIAKSGKPVKKIVIQDVGGAAKAVAEGTLLVQKMVVEASNLEREPCDISELVYGIKCGGSDTTSGLGSNPVAGAAADLVVENGGTVVFGETTEFIGAEHLLAKRGATPEVQERILEIVARIENRAKAVGADMRGGQPTAGNIAGGLTTIEEKSLGAIVKSGTKQVLDVYEYGQTPQKKGLVIMDSPGREPELLTGLAAAGCQVIVFTTGRGAPQGFPFVPVIKITANKQTYEKLADHMDKSVSGVIEGTQSVADAGQELLDEILAVASGKTTKAESIGYFAAMDIWCHGPVI